MSDGQQKERDWLDEAEVLLVGAWDVLGRQGPKVVQEVRRLRRALDDHKRLLAEAVADIEAAAASEDGMDGSVADKWRGIIKEKAPEPPVSIKCPRRVESGVVLPGDKDDNDYFGGDDTCSYCGSLNPATFMDLVERGNATLIPTDKNYKVYVSKLDGTNFPQWHSRTCPDVMKCDRRTCEHWTKGHQGTAKFYFQHLDLAQQVRFIELVNQKKLKFGEPGHFYVLPFFCKVGK